ncbi:MAG: hypothetical protein COV45_06760 [Deltaproteobacteria bacterium CG11_big_fil_rev_8_21_14_0_20_47_16]|nr:MAG: hypothetical protein COV45_06760 [Deltaproteobacteria bacterium CG11_big_fil_rev_8_21_14_0_20_47_16]
MSTMNPIPNSLKLIKNYCQEMADQCSQKNPDLPPFTEALKSDFVENCLDFFQTVGKAVGSGVREKTFTLRQASMNSYAVRIYMSPSASRDDALMRIVSDDPKGSTRDGNYLLRQLFQKDMDDMCRPPTNGEAARVITHAPQRADVRKKNDDVQRDMILPDLLRPGIFGQTTMSQKVLIIGAVLAIGAASAALKTATAAWSFIATPPQTWLDSSQII